MWELGYFSVLIFDDLLKLHIPMNFPGLLNLCLSSQSYRCSLPCFHVCWCIRLWVCSQWDLLYSVALTASKYTPLPLNFHRPWYPLASGLYHLGVLHTVEAQSILCKSAGLHFCCHHSPNVWSGNLRILRSLVIFLSLYSTICVVGPKVSLIPSKSPASASTLKPCHCPFLLWEAAPGC